MIERTACIQPIRAWHITDPKRERKSLANTDICQDQQLPNAEQFQGEEKQILSFEGLFEALHCDYMIEKAACIQPIRA